MIRKLSLIGLVVTAFGFASAARTDAGTDIVRDYGAQSPAYNYVPPPPPVYYAPPPVRVVVYPTYAYYVPTVRVFGRFCGRRVFCRP